MPSFGSATSRSMDQFTGSAHPRYALAACSASSGVAPENACPVSDPGFGGGASSATSIAAHLSPIWWT